MDPSKVVTAGAFVLVKGRIPFVVGPTPDSMAVAVIRLGGHLEDGETPWECVRRECYEEAQLHIKPIQPPMSFRVQSHQANDSVITPVEDVRGFDPVAPITISDHNWMYLATSEDVPHTWRCTRTRIVGPDDHPAFIHHTLNSGRSGYVGR
jgi:8-oxo-dGTP pyrophosphatase MutT (NUDIX family)